MGRLAGEKAEKWLPGGGKHAGGRAEGEQSPTRGDGLDREGDGPRGVDQHVCGVGVTRGWTRQNEGLDKSGHRGCELRGIGS